ncbi:hypothetical protein KY345_00620 [Candidatus Woesearchaeota archaeon]|nr:hypothetical protein [Candidatus Woesearchaeota archaeon]
MKKKKTVSNLLQKNYTYYITEPEGKNFDPEFKPELTPKQMLELGIFGGWYRDVDEKEFPKSWFKKVKFSKKGKDPNLNFFKIKASMPLSYWIKKGWIYHEDPRGWFQWYCRYYIGRRCPDDKRQIKRWKAFKRHAAQLKKNCKRRDFRCRPKQRQALLHWAYDSRKI